MVYTKKPMIAAALVFQASAQPAGSGDDTDCICDDVYSPVHVFLATEPYLACATYPNECEATCDGYDATDIRPGRCPIPGEFIDDCAFPDEFDPVCGSNGETYSNSDEAACHQIYDVETGECVEPAAPGTYRDGCVHLALWDPVCGSNGVTYSNSGEAFCYSVTEYTSGPCARGKKHYFRGGKADKGCKGKKGGKGKKKGGKGCKDSDDEDSESDEQDCDACLSLYEPLMAIDYLAEYLNCTTFDNECEAGCAGIPEADKRGLDRTDLQYWLEDGVCPQPGEYLPGCTWLIPLFDWVCGSNGVTYQNSGEARCNGIFEYTSGSCDDPTELVPPGVDDQTELVPTGVDDQTELLAPGL